MARRQGGRGRDGIFGAVVHRNTSKVSDIQQVSYSDDEYEDFVAQGLSWEL